MINGFRPVRSKLAGDLPAPSPMVMANSVTMKIGSLVKLIVGGVDIADAVDDRIYGVCVGFVTPNGRTYLQEPASFDGTYTQAVSGDTYASASNNLTVKKVNALVIPVEGTIFSGKLTATKGTTTGSDKIGYYLSVKTTDASLLDEATSTATSEQFLIVGFDPIDPSRPLVEVVEYQLYN